jgi:uncharacterized protein (TIGR02246 family)
VTSTGATHQEQERNDEQQIRTLVNDWLAASKIGDVETLQKLLADDVIFMVPGMEPFGKEAFAKAPGEKDPHLIQGTSDIKELKVLGDWAWMRSHLEIMIGNPDGTSVKRAGYVLTILRKNSDGRWVIARDANLLAEL